jgi:hypothetical protein
MNKYSTATLGVQLQVKLQCRWIQNAMGEHFGGVDGAGGVRSRLTNPINLPHEVNVLAPLIMELRWRITTVLNGLQSPHLLPQHPMRNS